jgi:HK97 family phage major capsid protein
MNITEHKLKRAGLVAEMRALTSKASAEKRDLNADEESKYVALEADVDKIGRSIDREENLLSIENKLSGERDSDYRPGIADANNRAHNFIPSVTNKAYDEAIGAYLRRGSFSNVLQTGIDADGGFLLPVEYANDIVLLQYNMDPMRQLATVESSNSIVELPAETADVTFELIEEGGTYPTVSPTFGKVRFRAFKIGGMIPATDEMLRDTTRDLRGYIARIGSRAATLKESALFATGNGANQPEGIFTVSSVVGVSVSNTDGGVSATPVITGDNLIDIFHDLPQYHRPRASWLTSDALVKTIRKLKSNDNQYLWQPGLQAGQPDRLLNRPVYTSDYAPAPAVSTKSLVFGDIKQYVIKDRLAIEVKYLDQLYAATGKVAWRFTKRVDARLVDATAIVTYTHGAAG